MAITNPDEYRFRCPNGHVNIRRMRSVHNRPFKQKWNIPEIKYYYCKTCKQKYVGSPIDLLEDE